MGILLLAVIILISMSSSAAFASDDSEEEQQNTVNVGVFCGEGYAEIDHQGNWSGVDIEITENIAQTAGFPINFVEEVSVKQGLKDLDNGKIDMLADIAKTAQREQNYLFSEYEQAAQAPMFCKDDDSRWSYENTDQLKTMVFSCEKDNIAETDFKSWCGKYGFVPNIVLYDNGNDAAKAVISGEADGYIDGEDYLEGFRSILSFAPSSYYYIFFKE